MTDSFSFTNFTRTGKEDFKRIVRTENDILYSDSMLREFGTSIKQRTTL